MDAGFSSYHNSGPARETDFPKLAQSVGTSILKITQNVSSIQRMVNQLGGPTDTKDLHSQLHQIQHYTQQLAKDTGDQVKTLNSLANSNALPPNEQRQYKLQREKLQEEFMGALNAFQMVQRQAASREKELVRKAKASVGIKPYGERKQETLIELQDNRSQRQIQQEQQHQQQQEEQNLRQLEEQEANIRQLESDIGNVNQIFKELGAIVHEQGEVIDSIEASVERTEVFVSEGSSQLRQAASYKNKVRKKKVILITIAAVILAILIGIIAWKSS